MSNAQEGLLSRVLSILWFLVKFYEEAFFSLSWFLQHYGTGHFTKDEVLVSCLTLTS